MSDALMLRLLEQLEKLNAALEQQPPKRAKSLPPRRAKQPRKRLADSAPVVPLDDNIRKAARHALHRVGF